MKLFFYMGVIGLILFEFLNVYFIMPLPGSQRIRSIDFAYFLYTWRWAFRGVFSLILLIGFLKAFQASKWFTLAGILLVLSTIYVINFEMAADSMFYQPKDLLMKNAQSNKVEKNRIILGIELNGEAKAYPIALIAYNQRNRIVKWYGFICQLFH